MVMKVNFMGTKGGTFHFEGSAMEFEALMENFDKIQKFVDLETSGELTEERNVKEDQTIIDPYAKALTEEQKAEQLKPSYSRKGIPGATV